jgi:hypothetical protein
VLPLVRRHRSTNDRHDESAIPAMFRLPLVSPTSANKPARTPTADPRVVVHVERFGSRLSYSCGVVTYLRAVGFRAGLPYRSVGDGERH